MNETEGKSNNNQKVCNLPDRESKMNNIYVIIFQKNYIN